MNWECIRCHKHFEEVITFGRYDYCESCLKKLGHFKHRYMAECNACGVQDAEAHVGQPCWNPAGCLGEFQEVSYTSPLDKYAAEIEALKAKVEAEVTEDVKLIAELREEISYIGERMDWTVLQNAKAQAAIPDDLVPGGGGKTLPERVAALVERLNESHAEIAALKAEVVAHESHAALVEKLERMQAAVPKGQERQIINATFEALDPDAPCSLPLDVRARQVVEEIAALKAKLEAAEGLMVVTERCGAFASTIGTLHSPLLLAINEALEAARKAGLGEHKTTAEKYKRLGIPLPTVEEQQAKLDRETGKRVAEEPCATCGGCGIIVNPGWEGGYGAVEQVPCPDCQGGKA